MIFQDNAALKFHFYIMFDGLGIKSIWKLPVKKLEFPLMQKKDE